MNLVSDKLLGQQLDSVILPHPRTGDECLFFGSGGSVYEVVKFSREIGCLFVGDSVEPGTTLLVTNLFRCDDEFFFLTDASISFLTPVDPLILLLPVLLKVSFM